MIKSEYIYSILLKYHLTPVQHRQVCSMIFALCRGKKVLFIAPRKAGQATIYRVANEIAKELKVDNLLKCSNADSIHRNSKCKLII